LLSSSLTELSYSGSSLKSLSFVHYFTELVGLALMLYTLVARRFSVCILASTPAILTEVFHVFSQSLQANARIVPWLGHGRFFQILSNSSFINHTIILCCIL
jgi:hypothetical protein